MKKSILKFGDALSKSQQQSITGGMSGGSCASSCNTDSDCDPGQFGCIFACINFAGGVCVYDTRFCTC